MNGLWRTIYQIEKGVPLKCLFAFQIKTATIIAMKIAPNPIHRKVIVPWYDSDVLCACVFIFCVFVFVFGVTGICVSAGATEYKPYGWLPWLLTLLSVATAVSIGYRMMKRYMERYEEEL